MQPVGVIQPVQKTTEMASTSENIPKIISAEEVNRLLDIRELLEVIEKGLGSFSMGIDGGVDQPVRTVVSVKKHHG